VIEGGTLIDGNGGPPIPDAQIVLSGNRIVRIGRKGAATPAGARVIRADGKFILPGLWDALLNFFSYQGEALLNNGVTSFIGIGNNGETGVFMRDGIVKGRILSPVRFRVASKCGKPG
jgi:cytosine/adenosine deaminase-related metal-dependent hydrolase